MSCGADVDSKKLCLWPLVLPGLAPGAEGSTAEVEDELLALWSSVEKDKAAARERAAVATAPARRRRRQPTGSVAGEVAVRRWKMGAAPAGGHWQPMQVGDASLPCSEGLLVAWTG